MRTGFAGFSCFAGQALRLLPFRFEVPSWKLLEIRFKFEQALNFARKWPSPKHFLKLFFSGTSDAQFSPLLLRRGHVFVSSSLSLCSVPAKFRIS